MNNFDLEDADALLGLPPDQLANALARRTQYLRSRFEKEKNWQASYRKRLDLIAKGFPGSHEETKMARLLLALKEGVLSCDGHTLNVNIDRYVAKLRKQGYHISATSRMTLRWPEYLECTDHREIDWHETMYYTLESEE